MNRIRQTLDELGIAEEPEATLTRSGAFFALVGDLLLYSDGRGVRRMSLRAMTRIRSDERGVLKIETPAGTGLSVSLRGFDPEEVQPFFLRVRDATAYAKAQAAREAGQDAPTPKNTSPEYANPEYTEPEDPEHIEPKRNKAVRVVRQGQPVQEAEAEADTQLTVRPADLPAEVSEGESTAAEAYAEAEHDTPYEDEAWDETAQAPDQTRQSAAAHTTGRAGWKKPRQRLQRWPNVLRVTAGVLALAAVALALYYLLAGAIASALWLLVAGLSGSVFMLANADALAVWLSTLDD